MSENADLNPQGIKSVTSIQSSWSICFKINEEENEEDGENEEDEEVWKGGSSSRIIQLYQLLIESINCYLDRLLVYINVFLYLPPISRENKN